MNQPSLFGAPQGRSARAYVDGGSRGNPGPAGYGVRIEQDDGSVIDLKQALGLATNNVAEYSGLIAALRWAAANDISRLHVRADSELLVKQMRGEYRVKSPGLQPLYEQARALLRQIGSVTFEPVRRESNKDADRLANRAVDRGGGREVERSVAS